MNNSNYQVLEPKLSEQIGQAFPGGKLEFSAGSPVSLYQTTSFLFVAAIMIIILVAAVEYMIAGVWRIQASQASITKSDKQIRRVTVGLVGVLSLIVIIFTLNKGLAKGDVGFEGLRRSDRGSGGLAAVVPGQRATSSSNTSSRSCESKDAVIAKLQSQEGLCGGTTCSALSGCNYRRYLDIIRSESARQGVDEKLVVTVLCTESKGNPQAENKNNSNGTYDCGLMQVNQNGPCSPSSLDPATNIATGVARLKNIVSSTRQVYTNIPQVASYAAAYNAGPGYNNPSVDCNTGSGFPFTPPKWACPINPGDAQFNMCSVKSYACDVSACVGQLSGADL